MHYFRMPHIIIESNENYLFNVCDGEWVARLEAILYCFSLCGFLCALYISEWRRLNARINLFCGRDWVLRWFNRVKTIFKWNIQAHFINTTTYYKVYRSKSNFPAQNRSFTLDIRFLKDEQFSIRRTLNIRLLKTVASNLNFSKAR